MPDMSALEILASMQKEIHAEQREHRLLFSQIKDTIADQKNSYVSLAASINNLTVSIGKHENIMEKVIELEHWRDSAHVDRRLEDLESWRDGTKLWHENIKGRAIIILGIGGFVVTLLLLVSKEIITYFIK